LLESVFSILLTNQDFEWVLETLGGALSGCIRIGLVSQPAVHF